MAFNFVCGGWAQRAQWMDGFLPIFHDFEVVFSLTTAALLRAQFTDSTWHVGVSDLGAANIWT